MKNLKWIALTLFFANSALAQLPTGFYSGTVFNGGFNEWCRLNRAVMDFTPQKDGSVFVRWTEEGFAQFPGGGFCENNFDATFTPTGVDNVWDVRFNWIFDLNFGRATLRGDILEIDATYTGMRTGFQSLRVRLRINPNNNSITYDRRIDRWGPTFFANGVLYK